MYLLTLNAPGDEGHHRWIPGKKGRHGVCGCEVARAGGDDLWNGTAAGRWNVVRTWLKRTYPGLEYARAVEVQRRGLLHHHVVVWSPVPLEESKVQEAALRAGYGCVFDLAPLDNPAKAARYLAKYVSKAIDSRPDVPWLRHVVDKTTGEVRVQTAPTYRAGQASFGWPLRMKELRDIARKAAAVAAQRQRELAEVSSLEREQEQQQPTQEGSGAAPPG